MLLLFVTLFLVSFTIIQEENPLFPYPCLGIVAGCDAVRLKYFVSKQKKFVFFLLNVVLLMYFPSPFDCVIDFPQNSLQIILILKY